MKNRFERERSHKNLNLQVLSIYAIAHASLSLYKYLPVKQSLIMPLHPLRSTSQLFNFPDVFEAIIPYAFDILTQTASHSNDPPYSPLMPLNLDLDTVKLVIFIKSDGSPKKM